MISQRCRKIMCAVFVSILPALALADAVDYPNIKIANPFTDATAIDRLFETVPGTLPAMREFLPQIRLIEYSFEKTGECPMISPTICSDPREKPYYRAERNITVRLPNIDATVARAVEEMQYDGCSYLKTLPATLVVSTGTTLVYQAAFDVTKRACGDYPWPFTGGWKTNIATGSGQVTITINLVIQPSQSYVVGDFGSYAFRVDPPSVQISTSEIFGMFNSNSLVGKLLTGVVELSKFVVDSATFRVADLGLENSLQAMKGYAPAINFAYSEGMAEKAIRSVPDFYKIVEQLRLTKPYFIDSIHTKLATDSEGYRVIEIHQFASIPGPLMQLYYAFKQNEIDYFADLPRTESEYIVKSGENLWEISRKRYGAGDAWYVVAHVNELKSGNVRPMQRLKLPRLWQLTKIDNFIVRPGDSLTDMAKRTGEKITKLPLGSKNRNKIYPYQVVQTNAKP